MTSSAPPSDERVTVTPVTFPGADAGTAVAVGVGVGVDSGGTEVRSSDQEPHKLAALQARTRTLYVLVGKMPWIVCIVALPGVTTSAPPGHPGVPSLCCT